MVDRGRRRCVGDDLLGCCELFLKRSTNIEPWGSETFQAFTVAASDDQTKDAVLIATANSIFDNVPTGLADQRSRSDMRILDLARPVARMSGDGSKG